MIQPLPPGAAPPLPPSDGSVPPPPPPPSSAPPPPPSLPLPAQPAGGTATPEEWSAYWNSLDFASQTYYTQCVLSHPCLSRAFLSVDADESITQILRSNARSRRYRLSCRCHVLHAGRRSIRWCERRFRYVWRCSTAGGDVVDLARPLLFYVRPFGDWNVFASLFRSSKRERYTAMSDQEYSSAM